MLLEEGQNMKTDMQQNEDVKIFKKRIIYGLITYVRRQIFEILMTASISC